ncbi:MAG: hypothetical protein NUV54_03025 [Candidatus Taylorbacteria bacterium]|nr:hypothetical protein [Candidatus Taylorbacteria bacterium]
MSTSSEGHSEVEYTPEESLEKQLSDFKEEIATLKKQQEQAFSLQTERNEVKKGAEKEGRPIDDGFTDVKTPVHFESVNPNELTIEDRNMWEIVKQHMMSFEKASVTPVPIDTLWNMLRDYQRSAIESGNDSRIAFAGFIANRLTVILGYESMKRREYE